MRYCAILPAAALSLTAGPGLSCLPAVERSFAVRSTIPVAGSSRSYLLHTPPALGAVPGQRFPLVLAFHGGGGTAEQLDRLTGLRAFAEREQFFLAFPQGVNNNWNDGRPGINDAVDDVGFVRVLLDELTAAYPIDPARVYATGLSNGGHFCQRLAFDLGDRIAAIAPVAAALSTALAARAPPPPTPILMIVGDADPISPYSGGLIRVWGLIERGAVLSAAAAMEFWIDANAARRDGPQYYYDDADPRDGTRVRRAEYPADADRGGRPVVVLTVEGGGHAWPGGEQYLPVALIGHTSRDISASAEIWAFFAVQSR